MTTDRDLKESIMLALDSIELGWPERFWMATRDDFPSLEDPDVTDGHQRHADRDEIRWQALGAILTEAGAALATGRYTRSDDVSDTIEIPISSAPANGLTRAELKIIERWWTEAEAPLDDPWADNLYNGRHRLWNVWKHNPEAVLPIRSVFLDGAADLPYLDHEQAVALAGWIREQATSAYDDFTPAFRQRSPLYVDAIDKARSITAP